jgi:periplasmic protein TonB
VTAIGSFRSRAWAISLATHVVVLALLVRVLDRRPVPSEPPPSTLVYLELVPPPPPAAGLPAGAVEPPAHVEAEPEPTAPPVVPPTVQPKRANEAPKPRPVHASPRATPAAAEGARGTADGTATGEAGGTSGGITGGTPGGTGDMPIPAARVARPPVVVERTTPVYPPIARARGLEGQVLLSAVVGRSGTIDGDVIVVRSVPGLDDAAVTALRRWRFTPGRDAEGRTVRVLLEVPMRFQLR